MCSWRLDNVVNFLFVALVSIGVRSMAEVVSDHFFLRTKSNTLLFEILS